MASTEQILQSKPIDWLGGKALKLVAINALVLFVLFNLVYWALPIVEFVKSSVRHHQIVDNPHARLPNYTNVSWAAQHYRELHQLKSTFKSFIGSQLEPFDGETIKVVGPYGQRRTTGNHSSGAIVYFFGGSTMWGFGSNDEGTIPSQFAALTGMHSENFGQSGHTAHQNLLRLIQLLQEGHRPDLVVFYNGGNDVGKCLKGAPIDGYDSEPQIAKLLKEQPVKVRSFSHYLAPLLSLRIKNTVGNASEAELFECQTNAKKPVSIAENLISDWEMAKRISESFGAKFLGILHPVAFFSRTRREHIAAGPKDGQYRIVYPLIQARLVGDPSLYDFTSVVDVPEFVYIDCCHLSPSGNRLVAQRIATIAGSLGITR
jgi:lysophospholipase L1-like esterase